MTRIVRDLMTRPGNRRCPYCRRDGGEFPSSCNDCGWHAGRGPGRSDHAIAVDLAATERPARSATISTGRTRPQVTATRATALAGAVGAQGA